MRGEEESEPRMPEPLYSYQETGLGSGFCQICGEHIEFDTDDLGEFTLPDEQTDPDGHRSIVAHGQCGLDHNLRLA